MYLEERGRGERRMYLEEREEERGGGERRMYLEVSDVGEKEADEGHGQRPL